MQDGMDFAAKRCSNTRRRLQSVEWTGQSNVGLENSSERGVLCCCCSAHKEIDRWRTTVVSEVKLTAAQLI
jgi:hypothetical protein